MRHHHWASFRHQRRHRHAALGLAGMASLAAALLATGCRDEHGRGDRERGADGRAEARVERALDWLDLEGDARERARTAALGLAREASALRDDGRRVGRELLAEWRRDTPDRDALRATVDRELDDLRDRAHRALDDVLALHAALDPEQRTELAERLGVDGRDHRHRGAW